MTTIEQLARDLLARLSYDYGDGEDCPAEVQALFDRGEQLLPVGAAPTASDTAAELAALRDEVARLREACEKALHFHNRYCDRVGVADSSWAVAVHDALRAALEAK